MTFAAAVSEALSAATGERFLGRKLQPISGGDIHKTFSLSGNGRHYFIKANQTARLPLLEAERDGLNALNASGVIRVPQPLCTGVAVGHAFLVLEYLDLQSGGDATQLGRQLARLHRVAQGGTAAAPFGWGEDNWIGSTLQPNGWHADWIGFWRDQRLRFQLELAARNGLRGPLQSNGEHLLSRMHAFFEGYVPAPSLLHGDLWGGNHGYLADGSPVIFDPAVYVGDRECDLAMTELFGGYSADFYAAYREAWPLDAGYGVRKTLYNLYHILNHANLFGGGYGMQAERMIGRLLAELG